MRQLRMSEEQSAAIEAWAKRQADKPSWSEAVRRLIDITLGRSLNGPEANTSNKRS